MSEEIRKYLLDILECVRFISEQTAGIKAFEDYRNNKLVKAAVERKLEIIGEALGKALKIGCGITHLAQAKYYRYAKSYHSRIR